MPPSSPIFYANVAAADLPANEATARYAFTASIALALMALLMPVLGAVADYLGVKKRLLGTFLALGALATATMFFIGRGDWVFASALFVLGHVGLSGANVFYNSLLPHIAREGEVDRVSSAGYALGLPRWRAAARDQSDVDPVSRDNWLGRRGGGDPPKLCQRGRLVGGVLDSAFPVRARARRGGWNGMKSPA